MEKVKLIWEENIYRDLSKDEIKDVINEIIGNTYPYKFVPNMEIEQEVDGTFAISYKVVTESYMNGEQAWKSE